MNVKDFEQDIVDLFLKKRGGHTQKWVYGDYVRPDSSTGSSLWHDFLMASKNFSLTDNEIDLIPTLIRSIDKHYDAFVDFGVGDKKALMHKTLPLINAQKDLKKYHGIDISQRQLAFAKELLSKNTKDLDINLVQDDFYKTTHRSNGNKVFGSFLGATITNQEMLENEDFSKEKIAAQIKKLFDIMDGKEESSLAVSFDANPNLENALESYNHPSLIRMMTGLMYDVQGILKPEGDFHPSMWHYNPLIDHDKHMLSHAISPSIDQNFKLGGQDISVEKSDRFLIVNIFKFPVDLMKELISLSDRRVINDLVEADEHTIKILEVA